METKNINTRLKLKYDTLTNWTTNDPALLKGEVAICYVPTATDEVSQVPAILMKVGEDGVKKFTELPWVSGLAADVYGWAKAAVKPEYKADEITGLSDYISGEIQDTDTQYKLEQDQTDKHIIRLYAKALGGEWSQQDQITIPAYDDTALKSRLDALEGFVEGKKVSEQIASAIEALNLGTTYETKTDASAKLAAANKHTDDAIALIKDGTAIDSFADVETELAKYQLAGDFATKAEAQGYADAKDGAIQAAQQKADDAYALAGQKATMAEVNEAIAGAGHAVKADVDQALEDMAGAYAEADTALEQKLQANIDKKVETEAYNAKVEELAGAIATEKERAEGIEGGLEERLAAVEEDYLTSADKEAIQNQINTIMNNPDTEGVINSITEFTQYINDHGEIAEGFRSDIDTNKQDIADLKVALGSEEGGLAKDVADNAAAIDTEKQRAEAKEAELVKADEDNLAAAKKHADDAIAALKIEEYAKDADLDAAVERIGALEAKPAAGITAENIVDWNDAVAKEHEHANKDVLDGITADKVAAWDAAQANVLEGVAGVDGSITDKTFTVTGVSTDLLTQGAKVLIFDCGDSTGM